MKFCECAASGSSAWRRLGKGFWEIWYQLSFCHLLDGGGSNVVEYHMPMVMIVLCIGIEFVRERGRCIVLHFHGGSALMSVRGALSPWCRRWCVASRCAFSIHLILVSAIECGITLDASASGVVLATLSLFRPRWNMAILTLRRRSFLFSTYAVLG